MGGRIGKKLAISQLAISQDAYMKIEVYSELRMSENMTYMKLSGIPPDAKGKVKFKIKDDGTIIAIYVSPMLDIEMYRYMKPFEKKVINDYFVIEKSSQYKGQGAEIFGKQVEALRAAGYTKIETNAAKGERFEGGTYNGYYTWARIGYKPKNENALLERIKNRTGIEYKSFTEMMRTNEGAKIWKEYGTEFIGTFDLNPNSESSKTLSLYLKNRKK